MNKKQTLENMTGNDYVINNTSLITPNILWSGKVNISIMRGGVMIWVTNTRYDFIAWDDLTEYYAGNILTIITKSDDNAQRDIFNYLSNSITRDNSNV